MATPYNYSSAITQPDIMGQLSYFQNLKAQQAQKTAQDRANEAQRLANLQQQKQLDALDTFTGSQRTYDDYMNLGVALGGENIKRLQDAFAGQTDLENQNIITQGGQLMSALRYSPEYALTLVDRQIEAAQNSDDKPTLGFYNNLRRMMVKDGKLADAESLQNVEMMLGATLTAVPGAKEMFENLNVRQDVRKKELMTPLEVKKATADANAAANTAKYAEIDSVMELADKGLDLSAQLKDPKIRKAVGELAVLRKKELEVTTGLEAQKLALEVRNKIQEINEANAAKVDEINQLGTRIDQAITQVDDVIRLGNVGDNFGTVLEQATGPIGSRLLTIDEDVANFEEGVAVLTSQLFMNGVDSMRGLGTLTEAEGDRLAALLGSLSLRQGAKRFSEELTQIKELLALSKTRADEKYPEPLPVPEPIQFGNLGSYTITLQGGGEVTVEQVE